MRKFLPYILAAFVVVAIILVCFLPSTENSGNGGGTNQPPKLVPDASEYAASRDVTGRNIAYVTMQITYDVDAHTKETGTVKILLDATSAPRTVANFLSAVKSGFYDGTDFFMAQQFDETSSVLLGGDPSVDGGKYWDDYVIGECKGNGYENDLQHKLGVLSMYHSNYSYDDGSSAFFISSGDISSSLDGYYAPFGYVISGYKYIYNALELGLSYIQPDDGLILKSRRPVITSITIDQDIDYSLISDIYAAPLTEEEIASHLGEDNQAKRISVLSKHPSIYRAYASGNNHLVQIFDKIDESMANILISFDNNGKIIGASALTPTKTELSEKLQTLVGLDLSTVEEAELSDGLKKAAKDALSADLSILLPTDEEIADILGEENQVKDLSLSSGPNTLAYAYTTGDNYLFLMLNKGDDGRALLLVYVSKDAKILDVKALPTTADAIAAQIPNMIGLDLSMISSAEISDTLKTIAKDAVSLVIDFSVVEPTEENIDEILGEDNEAEKLTVSSGPASLTHAYKDGESYLFQMISKNDDGLVLMLIHISNNGKILGVKALPLMTEALAQQIPDMIGLDLTSVSSAEISDSLKNIAKDAINLAIDSSVTAPTAEEIADILGEENEAKKIAVSFASASIKNAYKDGDNYLFQVISKSDEGLALLLIHVSKDGKILGVKTLPMMTESLALQASDMIGLDLAGVDASALPESLKVLAKDALRTVTALLADDSASKYIYTRDTEDHETYTVEMKIEGYDTPIVILLDKTTAPITVENFISLVEKGFYDGLTFHRIKKNFMIQGGDDSHLAADKQAASITGEFASNGWYYNDIKHIRGTISMARATDPNSAASGFFICDADASHLDGDYAAFGYVISGMETVDAIADYAEGKTDSNYNLNSGVAQPTIEYVKIIEN